MTVTTRIVCAGFAMCVSACASPPIHYYTLVSPAQAASTNELPAPFLVDVLRVGIPGELDQPQLVVRQGDSTLLVLEGERWAGPIADELRSAISADLTRQLVTSDIAGLSKPADRPVMRVKVQVRRFDGWMGQRALIEADWSLGYASDLDDARLVCHGHFEESATGGYPELIGALQRALSALNAKIGTDARRWATSRQSGNALHSAVGCS